MPPDDLVPHPARLPALDPPAAELRTMADAVVAWLLEAQAGVATRPITPRPDALAALPRLHRAAPRHGRPFAQLLEEFAELVVPGCRHNGHPRFFGYVSAPGTPVAALADLLASALNANLPAWRSAPAAVELEHVTIGWIASALGLDPGSRGLFVSGGSAAQLTALAAARHAHCGPEVARRGMAAHPRPLCIYTSREAHHSIHKAAALLGLGRENVREIAVDADRRMDPAALAAAIRADRAAGADPFLIVATAGTVVSGAVDPLAKIAALARAEGLWLHVDGCYGAFAALAPGLAPEFTGLAAADSVALDPHKWLYLPADCGCLIYRQPERIAGAFALDADYTRVFETGDEQSFAFWDYGIELSRRFRALKVWFTLAHSGFEGVAAAIQDNVDCARHLAARVEAAADFELAAPVGLSIVCFRHLPDDGPREPAALDAWNQRLLLALQADGSSYVSNADLDGRFALRACVLNHRTREADLDRLLEDLRRVAAALGPDGA